MVFTDSCWALAINEQVLTTMTSASSAREISWAPACASSPIITSLSTRFLGHPRLTKPTLVGELDTGSGRSVASPVDAGKIETGRVFVGMQALDFNMLAKLQR